MNFTLLLLLCKLIEIVLPIVSNRADSQNFPVWSYSTELCDSLWGSGWSFQRRTLSAVAKDSRPNASGSFSIRNVTNHSSFSIRTICDAVNYWGPVDFSSVRTSRMKENKLSAVIKTRNFSKECTRSHFCNHSLHPTCNLLLAIHSSRVRWPGF